MPTPRNKPAVVANLVPLVYQELRRLARRFMKRERSDHTLHNGPWASLASSSPLERADIDCMVISTPATASSQNVIGASFHLAGFRFSTEFLQDL